MISDGSRFFERVSRSKNGGQGEHRERSEQAVPPEGIGPVAQLGERLVCIQEARDDVGRETRGARGAGTHTEGVTVWACSSAGRAPGLQPGGRRFEPDQVHHLPDRTGAYSSVWLERTPDKREVGGSNPPRPTICQDRQIGPTKGRPEGRGHRMCPSHQA